MTPPPILELKDVHAGYGRIEVLCGVSLVVPQGAVIALLGPNGAGKTTLLRTMSGLLAPTSGHIHLADQHVENVSPADLTRAGLCLVPEGRGIFPNLTVEENLVLASIAGPPTRQVLRSAYDRFPILHQRRSQLSGYLSGGEQQMLSLARALACDPAVLLLDELSMGLAPRIVETLYDTVAEIAADGVSVVVVEQFAAAALRVADYAAVMRGGRIEVSGEPREIEALLGNLSFGGAA